MSIYIRKRLRNRKAVIGFIQAAISVLTSTRVSPCSCKYSKHQLLALLLFRNYWNQHNTTGNSSKVLEIWWKFAKFLISRLCLISHCTRNFLFRIKSLNLRLIPWNCSTHPMNVYWFQFISLLQQLLQPHHFLKRTWMIRKHFIKRRSRLIPNKRAIIGFVILEKQSSWYSTCLQIIPTLPQYRKVRVLSYGQRIRFWRHSLVSSP